MHNNHTDRLEELAKECINGLDDAHDQLFVPKGEFDLAFEEGKGFFKIMAMASRPPPGGMSMSIRQ
jgi:hypothetical protein